MNSPAASWPDRVIFGCLLALLLWVPLPWGAHAGVTAAFTATAFPALLLAWLAFYAIGRIARRRLAGFFGLSVLLWCAWLGWIALQVVPLPKALLALWSAHSVALWDSAAPTLASNLATISISPAQTITQLILSASYFALYLLVVFTLNSTKRIGLLLWALTLSGTFQALYGMHMTLTHMEYGFFAKKIYGIGIATGTFVNRDHYAAYLELTLAAGIGLVLAQLGGWRATGWREWTSGLLDLLLSSKFRARIMLVAMVAALVLTRSRMGNIAFFTSLCLCGVIFVLLRFRRWFIPGLLLFASLLLVDLLVVSKWFGFEAVVQRIQGTELRTETRALLLSDLAPIIRDFEITGAGLGTFALAYTPHQDKQLSGYFDHAHNEYAEFLIETGLGGCAVLGLLLLVHVLHCVRILVRRQSRLYAAAAFSSLMAITAMMVHATAEFMLRIPAVAITFVALLGLGMSISGTSGRSRAPPDSAEHPAQ